MNAMDEHAAALADAIEDVLPGWVERSVALVLAQVGGDDVAGAAGADIRGEAEDAGRRAAAEVGAEVRRLLAADIDEQRSTPLTLLREAVRYPTEVLRRAGVVPVGERDDVKVRLFPDDVYDLSPASFADIDPRLTEPGLVWGAAKAFEHRRRHMPQEDGTKDAGSPMDGMEDRKPMTRIAAYVPDLMDRSKVAGAGDVTFVSQPAALAGVEADVVVVDLMRPGVLDVLPSLSTRVIGFARHTEPALMAAAHAAGCDVVLARSAFFSRMDELLAGEPS